MTPSGEGNKEQATQNPNAHRHRHQQLLHLLRRRRAEAPHDILIERRHRREHQQRRQRVKKIDSLKPVILRLLDRDHRAGRAVDDPQPPESGNAVADLPPGVAEAVGEAEEEAGGGAAGEEAERGRLADAAAALTLVGERRRQNLERQDRPRREEVRQMSRPFESLSHRLLRRCFRWLLRRG